MQIRQRIFELDVRSLALFRVGIGSLLLIDLLFRAWYLDAHYTDDGILPRQFMLEQFTGPTYDYQFSVHLLHGSASFQAALFLLAAIAAAALLVGYRTRAAAVSSWLLLISLHSRNGMILDGGDVILRLLLFWGIFLPWGHVYSFDRGRSRRPVRRSEKTACSVGTAGLLIQICSIYWFSAILKSDPVWRVEGTAVYYALNVDAFATSFGRYLLEFPLLLKFLTFSTYWIEQLAPCLLFIPFIQDRLRSVLVFMFISLHLGFWLSLELGIMPWVSIVGWTALLPSRFWDRLGVRLDVAMRGYRRLIPKGLAGPQPSIGATLDPASAEKLPAAPRARIPRSASLLATVCIVYSLLWNVRTLDFERFEKLLPIELNWFGSVFRLDQFWNLFAPKPITDDGWFLIPAELENGEWIDLLKGDAPVSMHKPENVPATYIGQRWRKYLLNLWVKENGAHRRWFARYLCLTRNRTVPSGRRVKQLALYYMREDTLPDYRTAPAKSVLLYRHTCRDIRDVSSY